MTKNTQEIDIGGRGGGVVSKVQSLGPLHYSRLYSPQLLRNVDHNGVGVYLSPPSPKQVPSKYSYPQCGPRVAGYVYWTANIEQYV